MLDDKFEPQALFTVLLFTKVEYSQNGEAEYYFVTNRTQDYPAKSPMDMFESNKINNDLKLVIDSIEDYYS